MRSLARYTALRATLVLCLGMVFTTALARPGPVGDASPVSTALPAPVPTPVRVHHIVSTVRHRPVQQHIVEATPIPQVGSRFIAEPPAATTPVRLAAAPAPVRLAAPPTAVPVRKARSAPVRVMVARPAPNRMKPAHPAPTPARQALPRHVAPSRPAEPNFWLHGAGSQLYTAWGTPITLKAINWYGFEYAPFVPDGLDRARLDSILFNLRHLGFNALRITFADETVQSNPIVTSGLNANPELRGWHALDIMQRIIERAHHFGLRVILCNSRSEAGRGPEIKSGLWYTNEYSAAMWTADWVRLATRFRNDSAFVGADLRNEPHIVGSGTVDEQTYFKYGPLWGAYHGAYYHDRDWHWAAETLGNTLLGINPHLLIIVEGIQMYLDPFTNQMTGGLWGGNLIGVQYDRINLTHQSQLVYSVHEYGPHMWQADWFNPSTTYASLAQRWDQLWGYLLRANSYLRAPIFIGEFGTCHDYWACISDTDGWKQGFWFKSFVRYLHDHPRVSWAYWSLNPIGPFHPQDTNYYSLLSTDWHHYYPLTVRGLAPILSQPDGTPNTWSKDGLKAFPPEPGCSPDRSCVGVAVPQMPGAAGAMSSAPKAPTRLFPVQIIRNVPYVQPAGPYRVGDLYLPQDTGRAPRPAIVLVHGGSWATGTKGTPGMVLLAEGLARYGYVTFDINYRLAGHGGEYPKSIQDVEDAVAYLATQATPLHLDPTKIGTIGLSAGGYLALMAGYRFNVAPFAPPHYPGTHARISVIGSFFAPVGLRASVLSAGNAPRVQELAAYMGVTYRQNRALYKAASPLRYTDTAVPTIFWYGTADPMTPLAQTYELYKRLKQRQIRSELLDLPGAPHTLAQLSPSARDKVLTQLLDFLNGVLYHPTAWGG